MRLPKGTKFVAEFVVFKCSTCGSEVRLPYESWEKVNDDMHGFVDCPSGHRNTVEYITHLASPGLISDGRLVEPLYPPDALKGAPPPHFTGPTEIASMTDDQRKMFQVRRASVERERETARDR